MKGWIHLAVGRPILTAVVFLVISVLGLFSLWRLPIDLMPEITFPSLTIVTEYPNAGPRDVEESVTRPIEGAIAAIQGIEEINSTSAEGRSTVRASFTWSTDLGEATDDVRDRLDRIISRLPEDVSRPMVRKFDVSAMPIMILGASGTLDPVDLRELIEDQMLYRLERVPGVASVDVSGSVLREIVVTPDPASLRALVISADQIADALRRDNVDIAGGMVQSGTQEISLRTEGQFRNLDDIRNTVVAVRSGVPIKIGDLAQVTEGTEEIKNLIRFGGKPGVRLAVSKQSGSNTVAVADGVRKEIARLAKDFPEVSIVPVRDNSVYIRSSMLSMTEALLLGGLIAVAVLLLFLRNLSGTLIIALTIPISVIATFALIYFGGLTLNMMTFGGLALGIGMLVDSAIVVLDSVFHLREKGEEPMEAARIGATRVGPPVLASTLTTVAVFFPVVFMEGMSGVMFTQLAVTISFALGCSLLVSLTLVPMLSARFLKIPDTRRRPIGFFSRLSDRLERLYRYAEQRYRRVLRWVLRRRSTVILTVFGLMVSALLLLPTIGVELSPAADEGEVRISLEMEVGTKLEHLDSAVARIEEIALREVPELSRMVANMGAGRGWGAAGHKGNITLYLVPKTERKRSSAQVTTDLRAALGDFAGATVRVTEGQGFFLLRMTSGGSDESIVLEVRGYDLEIANDLAAQVKSAVERVPGVTDVRVGREDGVPEYVVRLHRHRLAEMGLTTTQAGNAVQAAMAGTQASTFRSGSREQVIRVRFSDEDRRDIAQLLQLPIPTAQGPVPLSSLAEIERSSGPEQIQRRDRERVVPISVAWEGGDLGTMVEKVREAMRSEVPSHPDFTILIRGDYEEQQKAFRELLFGILLAVLLVFLVMAAQFESFRDSLIVMGSVPNVLIGVVVIFLLTGTPFSMQAFLGLIILVGVIVNNAIVLVDETNRLQREEGVLLRRAVEQAGVRRLRPILMSTLTTVLGLLPLSLAIGEGSEAQAPMARAVIGGLLSGTMITLLLIPVLYSIAEQHKGNLTRLTYGKVKRGMKRMKPGHAVFLAALLLGAAAVPVKGEENIGGAEPLSLRNALELTLQHNPTVRAEKLGIAIAEARLKEARASYEPVFSARLEKNYPLDRDDTVGTSWQGGVQLDAPLPTGTRIQAKADAGASGNPLQPKYRRTAELTVTQSLLNGLLTGLIPLQQASKDREIAREELAAYAQRLLADVESAYWALLLARQEGKIHNRSFELAELFLTQSERRAELGSLSASDLAAARAEVASRRLALLEARAEEERAWHRLVVLIGAPDLDWESPMTPGDPFPPPEEPDPLDQHLRAAQQFRPDLKKARLQAARGDLELARTRNGLLPQLDAFISLGGTSYAESFRDAAGADLNTQPQMTVGATLSWPITNAGSRHAHTRIKAVQEQIGLSIENMERLATFDVRLTWNEVRRSGSLVEAARSAVEAETLKWTAEERRREVGQSTTYQMLQAQRDLLSAELEYARAQMKQATAVTQLYLADGTLLRRLGLE